MDNNSLTHSNLWWDRLAYQTQGLMNFEEHYETLSDNDKQVYTGLHPGL